MASPSIQGPFSGAVLAGGHSRRMGRDKALIRLDGESLLARQARVLREAGAVEVLVSQHPDRARPEACLPPATRAVWDDPEPPDAGPLAGLAAVLAAACSERVAIAAVDLPGLDGRWWGALLAQATPDVGVVGRRPGGLFEPLASVYPRGALEAVRRRLAAGNRALQDLVREGVDGGWLRAWPIPHAELDRVRNWNRPQDRGLPPSPHRG